MPCPYIHKCIYIYIYYFCLFYSPSVICFLKFIFLVSVSFGLVWMFFSRFCKDCFTFRYQYYGYAGVLYHVAHSVRFTPNLCMLTLDHLLKIIVLPRALPTWWELFWKVYRGRNLEPVLVEPELRDIVFCLGGRGENRRKQHEAIEAEVWTGSWSNESCGGSRRKQQEATGVEV